MTRTPKNIDTMVDVLTDAIIYQFGRNKVLITIIFYIWEIIEWTQSVLEQSQIRTIEFGPWDIPMAKCILRKTITVK